jgi:hypothetical protein
MEFRERENNGSLSANVNSTSCTLPVRMEWYADRFPLKKLKFEWVFIGSGV